MLLQGKLLAAGAKWCAILLICRFDVELLGKR